MKFYIFVVFSTLLAYANSQTAKSAAEIARQRAKSGSTSNCGTQVRSSIQFFQGKPEVGMGGNAKDMGPWLEKNGYTGTSKSYTEAQPDDVAVFPTSPGHSNGHAQIYDGKDWISDWVQKGFYPYKDGSKPPYKIYSPISKQSNGGIQSNGDNNQQENLNDDDDGDDGANDSYSNKNYASNSDYGGSYEDEYAYNSNEDDSYGGSYGSSYGGSNGGSYEGQYAYASDESDSYGGSYAYNSNGGSYGGSYEGQYAYNSNGGDSYGGYYG